MCAGYLREGVTHQAVNHGLAIEKGKAAVVYCAKEVLNRVVALLPMEAAQHTLIRTVPSSIVYDRDVLISVVTFVAALIVPAGEEHVRAREIIDRGAW